MDCLDRPPRTTLTKMNADAIIDYYAASEEAPRLTANPHGRLELARTRELLARLLPAPPASVLDVGGATGVLRTIQTGVHDSRVGFMQTHFHTGLEAMSEFTEAGLGNAVVYGVEGPGWGIATASAGSDNAEAVFDSALRAARAVEHDPLMHHTCGHLLVAATTPGPDM